MSSWKPQYKETVYCIVNDTVKEKEVASGLSMSDALCLLEAGQLFSTFKEANEYLRNRHAKQ